jgi:hypothetical protein
LIRVHAGSRFAAGGEHFGAEGAFLPLKQAEPDQVSLFAFDSPGKNVSILELS